MGKIIVRDTIKKSEEEDENYEPIGSFTDLDDDDDFARELGGSYNIYKRQ